MSDPYCMYMQQRGMMEMDMEGPYGEMDIEPGELDIEGPMAFQMLQRMGFGNQNISSPHYPEITLNHHVLEAMQKRFGVNTTAGIQRMSSNPEFQAFMYQVLTHSAPVSLAEFNANLTKGMVNEIIRNLDSGAPNHRIPAGNLNHAQLNTQGPSDGASLTLDNHPATSLFGNLVPPGAPFNPFVPNPAPLVQNPTGAAQVAQPGTFQALVQQPSGEGGEGHPGGETGERPEKAETKSRTTTKPPIRSNVTQTSSKVEAAGLVGTKGSSPTDKTRSQAKSATLQSHTKSSTTGSKGHHQQIAGQKNMNTRVNEPVPNSGHPALTPTDQPQTQPPVVGTQHHGPQNVGKSLPAEPAGTRKEQDIVGKDSKQAVSKDQRTRMENTNNQNTPVQNPVNNIKNPLIHNTGSPFQNPPSKAPTGQSGNRDSIPIGLKEAGLVPSVMNDTVPVKAKSGYTSTGFAIAAGTIIALIIILGPIGCMLWKMKEKREERLRKQKAHKNRDMSENSIMESMVLNDFGKGSANSVANQRAAPYDYFQYGKERYSMVNADIGELERLSGNPKSPRGRLP